VQITTNFYPYIGIEGKMIGRGAPLYLAAEVGTTANGDLDTALDLIRASAQAGMDAVKFQMINPDEFMADKGVMYEYESSMGIQKVNMYQMFKGLMFTPDEWAKMVRYAKSINITLFVSVDNLPDVDLAEQLGIPAYKIGAWDIRHYPLIKRVARTGKPILIDLGPSLIGEILQMLHIIEKEGNKQVMLVHECHGALPEYNMNTIPYLRNTFNLPVGFASDRVIDLPETIAITLGASYIEKRITITPGNTGHHHNKALHTAKLGGYVGMMRAVKDMLGDYTVKPSLEDLRMKDKYFTSLVYDADLSEGTVVEEKHLACRRPGTGISPLTADRFIGNPLVRDVKRNEMVRWEDV